MSISDSDSLSLENFLAPKPKDVLPYLRLEDQNNKYIKYPADNKAQKNVGIIVDEFWNKIPLFYNSDYYSINNIISNIIKKKIVFLTKEKFLKKKRGKKKDKNSKTKGTKTKFDKNNINIKIKSYCDNCIVGYLNECLKLSKKYNGQKFSKLSRKLKIKNINKSLESLKDKNLGDFIQTQIDGNINIFQQFENDEILESVFSEKYFHFFKNVFYRSNRRVKIKLNNNQNFSINLPDKVLMFNDLLEKDKEKKYNEQLKKNAIKFFIPNSIFIVNYNNN